MSLPPSLTFFNSIKAKAAAARPRPAKPNPIAHEAPEATYQDEAGPTPDLTQAKSAQFSRAEHAIYALIQAGFEENALSGEWVSLAGRFARIVNHNPAIRTGPNRCVVQIRAAFEGYEAGSDSTVSPEPQGRPRDRA